LSITWTFASPEGSGPDEPPHVVRAASIARGQLVGDADPVERGGSRIVEVPQLVDNLNAVPNCYKFLPLRSAACAPSLSGSGDLVETRTPAGAAPPLYYGLVAPPLALGTSSRVIELVRVLSALISAALVASAITLARAAGTSRFFLVGLFASLTPSAVFISGVVNPSSLEISSAILLWTSTILLFTDKASKSGRLDRMLAVAAAVSGALFVLARQLSPLWLAMIGVIVLVSSSWSHVRRSLRRVDLRIAAVVIVAATVAAVAWLRIEKPLASQTGLGLHREGFDAIAFAVGHLGYVYRSGIARFGWLDYEAPNGVIVLWSIVLGALVLLGLAVAPRKVKLAIVLLGIGAIVVPVLIEASQLDTLGPTWQGRYTIPLIMGVPLLCGLVLDRVEPVVAHVIDRLVPWLLGAMAIAQLLAFYFTLRRYVVGANGRVWFVGADGWDPVLPVAVLLSLTVLGVVLLYGWLATLAPDSGDRTLRTAA